LLLLLSAHLTFCIYYRRMYDRMFKLTDRNEKVEDRMLKVKDREQKGNSKR